CQQYNAWISF
nr:immunoglobulin light chain junction region [Macaca mulatta]MOX52475.1 immunoglobulin light chain junction region [Macaca mulatta]MOX52612.1 immunoglobulin light chain junction region [Macaca mulatta]MOX52709.1 immunoglobulin light chain junction region [Macaca mulatta]MOX52868.1 immunoglobulin light chain junction region [Macaca mulatta]